MNAKKIIHQLLTRNDPSAVEHLEQISSIDDVIQNTTLVRFTGNSEEIEPRYATEVIVKETGESDQGILITKGSWEVHQYDPAQSFENFRSFGTCNIESTRPNGFLVPTKDITAGYYYLIRG